MPFDTLTLKQVGELIPDRGAGWLKANRLFYMGDHWQGAAGWAGPMLNDRHELYRQTIIEIQRAFVSKNAIAEVVNRHVGGVAGREPMWSLTVRRSLAEGEKPSPEEQRLIDEGESLLTTWWDGQQGVVSSEDELVGAHKALQTAVATMLLSRRGLLRLFVPPGQLDENGQVRREALEQSIKKIFVHHPEPAQAAVVVDKAQMARLGCYVYEEQKKQKGELTYLDQGRTVVRIISEGDDAPGVGGVLDLNGRLTMYEMRRPLLITEQVQQLQRGVNLALTMLQRNVVQAGFLERTFFNTQLPGKEVPDPDNPGQTKFVPQPLHVGAGVTNFLSGVTSEDSEGNVQVLTPSVVYRDPVAVDTFVATREAMYRSLLEEVQQLHALISGDATASGESRKQARGDYEGSLLLTKSEVNAALRWLLETVLAMAAVFSGQPGRFAGLRVNAEARVNLGPMAADDQKMIMDQVDKGLLSKETGRSKLGVEDTEAEAERVASEAQGEKTLLSTALLNAQRGVDSGAASRGLEQPTGNTGGAQ